MKFNMYMPSMLQSVSRVTARLITFIFAATVIFVIGLCIYCCFSDAWESIILVLPFVFFTYALFIVLVGRPKSYVEADGTNIKVVYYILFIKKEKHISFSQIHEAYIEPIRVKGSSLMHPKNRPYEILFENEDGKRLFKVYYTEESYEFFKNYIVNYEAHIKRINDI